MGSRQVEIIVRRSGHPDRRTIVGAGVTSFGRAEDNDLVLSDIGISRRHGRLVIDENAVRIEDLGSGNGTFYRDHPIESQEVADGDEIVLDPFVLSFRFLAAQAAIPQPSTAGYPRPAAPSANLSAAPPAQLVVISGYRLSERYAIDSDRLTLGRSEDRDVVLFDPAASRRHFDIEITEEGYWLRDGGSVNGTFVNGRRARREQLSSGDRIRVGTTEFRFELLGEAATRHAHPAAMGAIPSARVPASARTVVHRPRRRPKVGYIVALIAAGLVVAIGVVAAGFLGWMLVGGDRLASLRPTQPVAPYTVSPENIAEVDRLLGEGWLRMYEGRPLESATRFYKVLFLEPSHPEAKWLGFAACEQIVFGELERGLKREATSASEGRKLRDAAIKTAEAALEGEGHLIDALSAVEEALIHLPDDARLGNRRILILQALDVAAEDAPDAAERKGLATQVSQARGDLDAGRADVALQGFGAVMEADGLRLTHHWYEARDGAEAARKALEGGG